MRRRCFKKKKLWHFRKVLNKVYPSCNDQGKPDPALNIEESDKGENSEMPTYEEIEESIRKLKNGREPGEDNNLNNSFCE